MTPNISVSAATGMFIEDRPVEIVERKGIGHPDSLCDGMAERISREYGRWCENNLGGVLHHNFDKVQLVAGEVDVGFGDALTPPPKREPLAVLLDFPAPRLLTCPWETVIAEKFEALVDLGMANSRMKDLFDLGYLSATLALDGAVLAGAIDATFKRRRTSLPAETPVGLSRAFGSDPVKQTQWRAFVRRLRGGAGREADPLDAVLGKLRDFLMPPVEALAQERPFKKSWSPGGPWR